MFSQCLFFYLGAKEEEKQIVLMRRQKAFHLEVKANQKLSKLMDVLHENDVLALCLCITFQ